MEKTASAEGCEMLLKDVEKGNVTSQLFPYIWDFLVFVMVSNFPFWLHGM